MCDNIHYYIIVCCMNIWTNIILFANFSFDALHQQQPEISINYTIDQAFTQNDGQEIIDGETID